MRVAPRLVIALALTASLLALAPAALADEDAEALCIIFVQPSQDFSVLEISADLILTPEQRANLSARIDLDDDGTINGTEVAAYENESRRNYDGAAIPDERRMVLDGAAATSYDVRTKLNNWTGPRAEAEKGVVTEVRYYRFDAREAQQHTLEGSLYVRPIPTTDPQVVIEVVVIDAPVDWLIAKVVQTDSNGNTLNETYPESSTYRISGFDLSRGSVVFRHESAPRVVTPSPSVEPPPERERMPQPGPGALALLAVLGIAAVTAKARRRRG